MRRLLLIAFIASFFACAQARTQGQLPIHETFSAADLSPDWQQDLSKGNTLSVKDGALVISARANTYAHLRRALNTDNFRATLAIRTDGASNWAPSIFLYWEESHWIQVTYRPGSFAAISPYVGQRQIGGFVESFGLLDQDMGQFYHYSVPDGAIVPNALAADAKKTWRYIGIEIDEKNMRALVSDDEGKTWTILRELARDAAVMHTPPKFLIVGKGAADPPRGLANENLNNDYRDPGVVVESAIKDIHVVSLNTLSNNPAKLSNVTLRDELGDKILAAPEDPTFDSVAGFFPAMKYGRELVGVKDHKDDFTVLPDGAVQYTGGYVYLQTDESPAATRFGAVGDFPAKRLHHGHLPIVLTNWTHDGLKYEQTIFAHSENFSADAPIQAYMRIKVSNPTEQARSVRLLCREHMDAAAPLANWDLSIPAAADTSVHLRIPYGDFKNHPVSQPTAAEFDALLATVTDHWEKLLSSAATLEIPEPRVNDAYRAWLAYNFLNVDKLASVYHPQDSSAIYPAVYGISAALYARTLDAYGYHDDARRYIESLLTMVQPDGTFIVNSGLPDAGALLTAMAEHYRYTGDAEWLKRQSPMMIKITDRFLARRFESRSRQAPADNWYGMIFEQPYCDYTEKAYNFVADLTLAGGLIAAGDALHDAGLTDEAERFRVEGSAYRKDILAAMKRSAIQRDGQTIIPMFPQTHALLKAVSYTALDYYSLEAGLILEKGLIDPDGWEAKSFVDMLEKRGGLLLGMCRFAGGIDHAYTYGYWFNCLQRNDAKKVLLGFYSSMAYGMTRDTYSGVEVTFLKTGTNYPTLPHLYSGTQQLGLLRAMLCYENGNDLILCNAIPKPWLSLSKRLAVNNFSTHFGDLSFSVESTVPTSMTIAMTPPTRHTPESIRMRLRHPDSKTLRAASIIDGRADTSIDGEYLVLRNIAAGPLKISANFD